jgi:capsular exopolysaccharide synthesis family protein
MDLRDYLRGLRRYWLAVVLMVLVGIGTAFAWTVVQTPVYESVASGVIQTRETEEQGGALYGDSFAITRVPTYLDMATWKRVAEGAAEELGVSIAPEDLATRVTVTNPEGTAILKFTAQGSTPEEAAALAQAWITALGDTIDDVEGGTTGQAPVSIFAAAAATVADTPIFPDRRAALIIGGILGLGLGIAFALVRTASDRRIRVTDDVEARVHVPVVGIVPISDAFSGERRLFDPAANAGKNAGFAVSESLRTLRTNLRFMNVDNPPRTMVVTSPLPGDGKSTVAANIAATLAASGEQVVLVDGDLRRPTVAKTLGLPGGAGLSDVLAGRVALVDVLQKAPTVPNLFVLTAGSIPPNPSEILGSARMRQVLEQLSAHATIIIDAPPLLPVTDGAVIAHQADGAILVVGVGRTTYDVLDAALAVLDKANGRVLGVVLNKVPLKGADAAPYSHAYHHEYPPLDPSRAPDESANVTDSAPDSGPEGTTAPRAEEARDVPVVEDTSSLDSLFSPDGQRPTSAARRGKRRAGTR